MNFKKFLTGLVLSVVVSAANAQAVITSHSAVTDCENISVAFQIEYGNIYAMENVRLTTYVSCDEDGPWEYLRTGGPNVPDGAETPYFFPLTASTRYFYLDGMAPAPITFELCCSGYYLQTIHIDGQLWTYVTGQYSFCECL